MAEWLAVLTKSGRNKMAHRVKRGRSGLRLRLRWLPVVGLASLLALGSLGHAQAPPAMAAYINAGSGWNPWTSAAGFGQLTFTPSPIALYCQATQGGAWTPCNPSGGGGSGITALTGDVTASGTGSVAATLATVNAGPGTCGSASVTAGTAPSYCYITTNGKGLITAQTAVALGTAASYATGTSGALVPLLNGTNTWSGTQTVPSLVLSGGGCVQNGTSSYSQLCTPASGPVATTSTAGNWFSVTNTNASPTLINTWGSGVSSIRKAQIDANGIIGTSVGAAVASASSITPTGGIFHVTGTTTIATIAIGQYTASIGGCITIIADGAWTLATSGNISTALTAVAGTPYQGCYDGTKWYVK
jgi:hypothetical protein